MRKKKHIIITNIDDLYDKRNNNNNFNDNNIEKLALDIVNNINNINTNSNGSVSGGDNNFNIDIHSRSSSYNSNITSNNNNSYNNSNNNNSSNNINDSNFNSPNFSANFNKNINYSNYDQLNNITCNNNLTNINNENLNNEIINKEIINSETLIYDIITSDINNSHINESISEPILTPLHKPLSIAIPLMDFDDTDNNSVNIESSSLLFTLSPTSLKLPKTSNIDNKDEIDINDDPPNIIESNIEPLSRNSLSLIDQLQQPFSLLEESFIDTIPNKMNYNKKELFNEHIIFSEDNNEIINLNNQVEEINGVDNLAVKQDIKLDVNTFVMPSHDIFEDVNGVMNTPATESVNTDDFNSSNPLSPELISERELLEHLLSEDNNDIEYSNQSSLVSHLSLNSHKRSYLFPLKGAIIPADITPLNLPNLSTQNSRQDRILNKLISSPRNETSLYSSISPSVRVRNGTIVISPVTINYESDMKDRVLSDYFIKDLATINEDATLVRPTESVRTYGLKELIASTARAPSRVEIIDKQNLLKSVKHASIATDTELISSTKRLSINTIPKLNVHLYLTTLFVYSSESKLLELQPNCSCGKKLISSFFTKIGFCYFTGKLCCQICISKRAAYIPARVIELLDITKYSVSNSAYNFLKFFNYRCNIDIQRQMSNAISIKNDNIRNLIKINSQINLMVPYVEACSIAEQLIVTLDRKDWFQENKLFSIAGIVSALTSNFVYEYKAAFTRVAKHIIVECQSCSNRAHICEYCKLIKNELIYPFQSHITICCNCKGVYHKECYRLDSCPKCIRLSKRKLKEQF